MSCFICDDETISALVKGFIEFNVDFTFNNYRSKNDRNLRFKKFDKIGQILLDENIKAYNWRYSRQEEGFERIQFEYVSVPIDEGIVYGCIRCYNYQLLELPEWESSDIRFSLERLQLKVVGRLIDKCGQEMFWGYPNEFKQKLIIK